MYFYNIKYKSIKEYHNKISPIIFRISSYVFIAILFYYFMETYSPLGIKWRPFHYERVINSIENILENPILNFIGYTSFDNIQDVSKYLETKLGEIYLVPSPAYLFYAFLYKFIPNFQLYEFGSFLDFILISILGFLVAELGLYVMEIGLKFESIFYGSILFSIFITSPWSYRMLLAPWHEVTFLTFYLLSIFLFINNKKYLGLLFVFLSGLMHWIWIFFLLIFVIFIKLINTFLKNLLDKDYSYRYLPNTLQDKEGFYLYSIACFLPILWKILQTLLLRIMSVESSGSSALSRIGIDSYSNIHHGGILAAFQFLGGNRYNLCFNNSNLNNLSNLEKYISYFNCSMSITSLVFLSILSILGLVILLKNSNKAKWMFAPLSWSLLFFCLLFQQSFAVHLQGHSLIFAYIFAINIVYFFKNISKLLAIPKLFEILIMIPITTGILINSIRVSFITGING